MPDIILKASEETVANTAGSTVSNAKRVYIYASGAATVTLTDVVANTVTGSITIPAGSSIILQKQSTDEISTDVDIQCTSIGYGI